ncbi:hypothetical protein EDC04DRAFT_2607345 [Pisolithus marmoratus]|nr:hypothetical protein EDC04DRAFT_2607345 [Pisolithus marmoratus]
MASNKAAFAWTTEQCWRAFTFLIKLHGGCFQVNLDMPSPHQKQSLAVHPTTRWLNKPGVLEAQWEKVHLCAAWKKVEVLAGDVFSDKASNRIPDQCDVDDDSESASISLHLGTASPTPTLLDLQLSIDGWKSDWGPESTWLKKFDECLRKACEKGLASTDHFFRECEIFDLLEVVLLEVKFFEVKLDEYAPAVPYSKVSDARYYSGM